MTTALRCVDTSVRIYQLMIKGYPASFRREYGSEMTEVFRDLVTDAAQQGVVAGLIAVWYRVLLDFGCTVWKEHAFDLQRRFEMRTVGFAVFSFFLAVLVYGVILCAVGISLITVGWITESPMFTTGRGNTIMEMVLVFAPAFITGMILVRVKPFFWPIVTATLGTMAYCGCIAVLDFGAPWWAKVGFVVSIGVVTILGCIMPTGFRRRSETPCAT